MFSRYPFCFAVADKTAKTVSEILVTSVFPMIGLPTIIQTDREKEFVGLLLENVCSMLGIKHRAASEYHPEAQGVVERANRSVKEIILSLINPDRTDWDTKLGFALWIMRNSCHESLKKF
jgi:transposase InsO family protein